MTAKNYKVRPTTIYTSAPMFTFTDRAKSNSKTRQTMLVSYPMLAKYTGLNSVKDIQQHRLVIKMKGDSSAAALVRLVEEIKKALP